MSADFDVAVIGSGFAGSICAAVLRRLGRSVVLLERGCHPRFAIGESTSPLMNLLIEELAARYDLPRLAPLATFGTWRRAYPNLVCGMKRGFTYYEHEAGKRFERRPRRSSELLVAASPNDEVADTHWLRSDVDHFLMREAVACGAEYVDEVALSGLERFAYGTIRVEGERRGRAFAVRARLVVDATGPRGFLARALGIPDRGFDGYPRTRALFSHFTGVARCGAMPEYASTDSPPYPPDDAALHHVFDGGWMWVLRFGNGVTSAGFSLSEPLASEVGLEEGEPAWRRLLARFPSIGEQFAEAEAIRPFSMMDRLSYRAAAAAGDGWVLLPSCAAFVDPLFSTGMPLALLGIERLARAVERDWGAERLGEALARVAQTCLEEADVTADFVGSCLAATRSMEVFAPLSMFYFTAASFSEMARRLGSPAAPQRFLASDRERFLRAMRAATRRVRDGRAFVAPARFERAIRNATWALNVAGICDPAKENWYGVDIEDVVRGASKLAVDPALVRSRLI